MINNPDTIHKSSNENKKQQIITVTQNAENRIAQLLFENSHKMLKISIKSRGCTGLSYVFECIDTANPGDEIVNLKNHEEYKIIIDSKAFLYIIGAQLDYIEENLSSRFIFNNPNAKGECGCGESFHI